MKIVEKALPNLTPAEYRCVHRLNYGENGYMREFLQQYRDDPECIALMIYRAKPGPGALVGWALLIPTRKVSFAWGPTEYSRKKSRYTFQVYVRCSERRQGHAHTLMRASQKFDQCPFVWPHDIPSGNFYAGYSVVANKWERSYYMKKRNAA